MDDERHVGAATTLAGAFVGWVDVIWPGPHEPVRQLNDVVHVPVLTHAEIHAELERARDRRDAALRACRYCEERFTPGHMHSADVCQGCAERHLGVVH
jgi:hypothetical protein